MNTKLKKAITEVLDKEYPEYKQHPTIPEGLIVYLLSFVVKYIETPLMKEIYYNDQLHGSRVTRYTSGGLKMVENFYYGKYSGLQKTWYESGTLREESNYKDNVLHGVQRSWYKDGNLMDCFHFKDGEYHGVQKIWYPDKTLERIFFYVNGNRHGIHRRWYSLEFSSRIHSEEFFSGDKPIGEHRFYFPTGRMSKFNVYKDGQLN